MVSTKAECQKVIEIDETVRLSMPVMILRFSNDHCLIPVSVYDDEHFQSIMSLK